MYRARSKNLFPNSIRIGLVDPNIAQTWAQRTLPDGTIVGEIKKGDTINHTTSQPIANGLFCQRVFGPCIDYTCACGQTKIRIHSNIHVSPEVCPDCHVEWTESSVRRHRLGFIQLISPVTHKWFADSGSAYIPALMGTTVKTFKAIRDCKLFFPFSLPDKEHSKHCFCSIENAKGKSGNVLLRYLLFAKAVVGKKNKKNSEKELIGNSYTARPDAGASSKERLLLFLKKKGKQSKLPIFGVLETPDLKVRNLRAMGSILAKSFALQESYIRKGKQLNENLETISSNLLSSSKKVPKVSLQPQTSKGYSVEVENFQSPIDYQMSKEKPQNPNQAENAINRQDALKKEFSTISFNGYHSFPVKPSFAQSEDYRRKFVKFFGNTGSSIVAKQVVDSTIMQQGFLTPKATASRKQQKRNKLAVAYLLLLLRKKQKPTVQKQNQKQVKDIPIARYTHSESEYNFVCQVTKQNTDLLAIGHEQSKPNSKELEPSILQLGKQEPFIFGLPLATTATFALLLACLLRTAKQAKQQQGANASCLAKAKASKTNIYNCIVRGPEFPVKSYFSEINSLAKEQTIKKILSQTGGGGLQKYLSLVDLGHLVALLKNDLDEIALHLDRYKYAKPILRNALNKTSSDLAQTVNLLEKLRANYLETVEGLTESIPTSLLLNKKQELSEKIARLEENYKYGEAEYKLAKKLYKVLDKRKTLHKRRYKLAFQLWRTLSNPTGLTMSSVPVLPPGLRPIIDVPKVGPIASDLNVRYRKLVFALRNLRDLSYVDFRITGAAQTSVQEAVDDILYTGGKRKTIIKPQSRKNQSVYKSLAMGLKGKHGRFRGNLLGKRVDYSGRSVIVVGPTLKIHQCGLPFELAIKLFHPFLIRRLIQKGFCKNVYSAKKALGKSRFKPQLWTLCREEMLEHLVVLNRAPTLHRLGVQAFMPVLITGRAILLHPLVCTGFNADFDGDQMAVHVPLFPAARAEAWKMMWSRNNFLTPSSGDPILLPSQDMVLGCYYLTESVLEPLKKNVSFVSPKTLALKASISESSKNKALLLVASPFSFITTSYANSKGEVKERTKKPKIVKVKELNWKTAEKIKNIKYCELEPPILQNSTCLASPILSVKAALNGYTTGFYNLHSIVWVSPRDVIDLNYRLACKAKKAIISEKSSKSKQILQPTFTAFNVSASSLYFKNPSLFHQDQTKQPNISPYFAMQLREPDTPCEALALQSKQGLENDGSSTPTLELRVSPYGVTRLLQTTGSKKRGFYSSLLLPANLMTKNSSFEIAAIRTTIGRLLFNDLLQKF